MIINSLIGIILANPNLGNQKLVYKKVITYWPIERNQHHKPYDYRKQPNGKNEKQGIIDHGIDQPTATIAHAHVVLAALIHEEDIIHIAVAIHEAIVAHGIIANQGKDHIQETAHITIVDGQLDWDPKNYKKEMMLK